MNWLNEWHAISGRIEGLISAGGFFISTLNHNSSDSYSGVYQASCRIF
ncbi:MAG: hypothetical protein KAT71_02920 [Gammaproteobacteria bacterium]|nr:hypothetical protein [Gammaproteobacteria bacterium]